MSSNRTELEDKVLLTKLTAFYGPLLTEKQRECLSLWLEEDYSLSEIAQEAGISRQGVHDTLHRGAMQLWQLEDKLGLLDRFNRMEKGLEEIRSTLKDVEFPRKENTLLIIDDLLRQEEEEGNGV